MKFIYGKEGFLVNQEVNRAIRELDIEPNIYSDNEPLDDILLDASTASMFSDKKLVIVKNHIAFSKDAGVDEFIEGIKKNPETEFIFTIETDKLDKKNKLVKWLLENAETKEFKGLEANEIVPTIKKIVVSMNGEINNNAAILLATKLPDDLRIIVSEIEKLLLENTLITLSMVETSTSEYSKDDYYALSNAISSGDAHGIAISYKKKRAAGEDVPSMISQISSIFSLALSVSAYRNQGFTSQDISDKLKIHIYRVKRASDLISNTNANSINDLIKSLAQLEVNIKTGMIDPYHGIETYLLNLIK